jgi:hypothetical protein
VLYVYLLIKKKCEHSSLLSFLGREGRKEKSRLSWGTNFQTNLSKKTLLQSETAIWISSTTLSLSLEKVKTRARPFSRLLFFAASFLRERVQ